MKHFLQKGATRATSLFRQIRKNKRALFLMAFLVGGGIKLGISPYVTMGYNDYIAEHHAGIDFTAIRQEAQSKMPDSQNTTNE